MFSAASALPKEHKSIISVLPSLGWNFLPPLSLVIAFPRLQNILRSHFPQSLVLKLVGTTLMSLSELKGVQRFFLWSLAGVWNKSLWKFVLFSSTLDSTPRDGIVTGSVVYVLLLVIGKEALYFISHNFKPSPLLYWLWQTLLQLLLVQILSSCAKNSGLWGMENL